MKTLNSFLILLMAATGSWLTLDAHGPLSTDDLLASQSVDIINADTLEWERPRFDQRSDERLEMVEQGIESRGIVDDQKVLDAMRHVPRHFFVPKNYQAHAYENRPLPIGYNQTISQPLIVAYMTDLAECQGR